MGNRSRPIAMDIVKAVEPARWAIPDPVAVRFAKEDDQVESAEKDLRKMQVRRAGRIINSLGWAWCSACGAMKVSVDPAQVRPVNGRVAAYCDTCSKVTLAELDALLSWRRIPEKARPTFPAYAVERNARPVSVEFLMAHVEKRLEEARVNARDVLNSAKDYFLFSSEVVLLLAGGPDELLASDARTVLDARFGHNRTKVPA